MVTATKDVESRAIDEMDEPLHNARDLIRALIMAIVGSRSAGFSESEQSEALAMLARCTQREVDRMLKMWLRAVRASGA